MESLLHPAHANGTGMGHCEVRRFLKLQQHDAIYMAYWEFFLGKSFSKYNPATPRDAYDYVISFLDDLFIARFDLDFFLRTMRENQLQVAIPNQLCSSASYVANNRVEHNWRKWNSPGTRARGVEYQMMVFTTRNTPLLQNKQYIVHHFSRIAAPRSAIKAYYTSFHCSTVVLK